MGLTDKARSTEQKEERRKRILDAAYALFVASDYRDISMASIVKKAGIAKGTLFIYFSTKEELFLSLTQREVAEWGKSFRKLLELQDEQKLALETFAQMTAKAVVSNEPVLRLLAILGTVLERNVDYDRAYEFKKFMKAHIVEVGNLIEERVQDVADNMGIRLYMYAFTLLIGLYSQARPTAAVFKVLQNEEFGLFRIDFEQSFSEMFMLIARGLNA